MARELLGNIKGPKGDNGTGVPPITSIGNGYLKSIYDETTGEGETEWIEKPIKTLKLGDFFENDYFNFTHHTNNVPNYDEYYWEYNIDDLPEELQELYEIVTTPYSKKSLSQNSLYIVQIKFTSHEGGLFPVGATPLTFGFYQPVYMYHRINTGYNLYGDFIGTIETFDNSEVVWTGQYFPDYITEDGYPAFYIHLRITAGSKLGVLMRIFPIK